MAQPKNPAQIRLSKESQDSIVAYVKKLLEGHRNMQGVRAKLEALDLAYARYKSKDEAAGETPCDVLDRDRIVPPILISQVDAMVANWADIFLSGYPLFPVVSTNTNREWAEQLEALLDDHATLGGYARQLLLAFRDGAKYDLMAIEAEWDSVSQFEILKDFLSQEERQLQKTSKYYTALRRLDLYNTFFDTNVSPGDVSREGDFAGYVRILSKVKLKRLLNKLSEQGTVYNADKAMDKDLKQCGTGYVMNYVVHPTISDYVLAKRPTDDIDWEAYMTGAPQSKRNLLRPGKSLNYEVTKVYARLIPNEFGIPAPQPNTPQIYKIQVVNGELLINFERVITAQDALPIFIGQPQEDGLGLQTQGAAEASIGFQDAAEKLYAIRFAAARRAVSDRAIYDSDALRPSDVNSKAPAAKIPAKITALGNTKTLDQIYRSIPFDPRGTETVLQDASIITEFSKELSGLNNAQRGQFQRGNKSVTEWEDVMANANSRTRLPVISMEFQIFVPLKLTLLMNIFQYGEDAIVVSQSTGQEIEVNIAELRKHVMAFRLADGHTPKAKMASTEMLMSGMNLIMNSPMLQQAYGPQLAEMFAHMMQLGGVRGLKEYATAAPGLPNLQQGLGTAPQAASADPNLGVA